MISPFLKWAGGKRWLVKSNKFPKPQHFNQYIEPFLGSGAVFFSLLPDKAILADINCDLIELYQVIRDDHIALKRHLEKHQSQHCKEYYYNIRSFVPDNNVARAARFIYLNRTCWNGLYRVNLKGQFNVPIGTRSAILKDTDDFATISKILGGVEFFATDFEITINMAQEGDFLFVDPPYTVKHNNNNFIKYNEKIFSWKDQKRLKECLIKAKNRGVQIVITNADHKCIQELYCELGEYMQFFRSSSLAADVKKRRNISEGIFLANFEL